MIFAPVLAGLAFALCYLAMALGRLPGLALDRTGVAFCAAVAVVLGGALPLPAVAAAIDFPTLFILFGLMIVSAQFAIGGGYARAAAAIAAAADSPTALLALTVLAGGLLSAVLVNDVVVFAMTPLLCRGLSARGLDARPYLIALAGASNAGSAATLIGNPQNIVIGEAGRLPFGEFVAVCGPPALLALLIVFVTVRLVFSRQLRRPVAVAAASLPAMDTLLTLKGTVATLGLIALYLAGAPRDLVTLAAAALLLVSRRVATARQLAEVDWSLLLLFACLFVLNGAVAHTGLASGAVLWLKDAGLGLDRLAVLGPLSLVLSNTIGNVPAVIMILALWPELSPATLHGLALLSTLAGNLFLVGSIANIIVAQRAVGEGVRLSFADHARAGVPMTLASMAAAMLWLAATGVLSW